MERNIRKCINKPRKIEEMTKEQIREAIIKKRECNAKAQNIVESLLEKCIIKSYFVECLPYINQSHFEDVIEERSIICQCGYPMCQNLLSEKDIPKQKYRISVKTNKVYDITARKKFCSNECYNSAMYVKKQMLTSPLWFREYEDIPKFHLLDLDSVGKLGETVDVSIIEKIKLTEKPLFTSINDFAGASLKGINDKHKDITDNHIDIADKHKDVTDKHKDDKVKANLGNNQLKEDMLEYSIVSLDDCENKGAKHQLLVTNPVNATSAKVTNSSKGTIEDKDPNNKTKFNPTNLVGDIVEKTSKDIDPILVNEPEKLNLKLNTVSIKTSVQKKTPAVTLIAIEVEKCLAEWFTIDTMLFLFGEERVKQMVTDKGECLKEYLNNYSNSTFYNSNTYDQYQELCRKLNLLEMEDRKYDANIMQRETKPLPDYSTLKEESKKMQLKVRAFLAGDMETPTETNETLVTKVDNTKCEHLTVLPPVDNSAQNALRRKIVCDHLNKMLPDLLRSLGLLTLSISSDVRLLVNTFKLKANNIMFKPIQWTLIAIVIIKLLSFRHKQLEYLLEQPKAYQHMQLLLLSYKQDGGYLDRLISWLIDVDRLLDSNDTQLTVG